MRYQSLDSIRVISGILVVLSHYSYIFENTRLHWVSQNIGGYTGHVGVSLFFLISGFLAANSLTKDKLGNFYIKKYIRIEVPYLMAFMVMSFIFILLSIVDSKFFWVTPLSQIIVSSGNYLDFIPILFAQDGIMNSLGVSKAILGYWLPSFTGQWFIGTILWIYLLAPFFNYLLNRINPWFVLGVFILISTLTYQMIEPYTTRAMWFFVCRIPEFLIGMILFKERDHLLAKQSVYVKISCFVIVIASVLSLFRYGLLPQGDTFFPLTPRLFFITLPLLLLFYYLAENLNQKYNLTEINKYSKYLYVLMLIHQVILFQLFKYLPYKDFSKLGYLLGFVLLLFLSVTISKLIVFFSKGIETWLVNAFVSKRGSVTKSVSEGSSV